MVEKIPSEQLKNYILIGPKNVGFLQMDMFFKTLYGKVLEKYDIKKISDFHKLELVLFREKDFIKKTSLSGMVSYLMKYYGFIVSESDVENNQEFEKNKLLFEMDDFYFLSEKEKLVLKYRIIQNMTLSEVGELKELQISRERVRQIEQKIFYYLKLYFNNVNMEPIEKFVDGLTMFCTKTVEQAFLTNDGLNLFKYYCINNSTKDFLLKYARNYDVFYKNGMISPTIFIDELKNFQHVKGKVLFTKEELSLLLKESSKKVENTLSCLINPDIKILSKYNKSYFLYPKTKSFAVEVYIALQKNGYHLKDDFDKFIQWMQEVLPDFYAAKGKDIKKENFNSLIEHNERILLWGWGTYIHFSNVEDCFLIDISEIKKFIKSKIEKSAVVSSEIVFKEFKDYLLEHNIPNHHALYTILRVLLKDEFSFKHCPWIRIKGLDEANIVDIIAATLKDGSVVSVKEVANMFGVTSGRATQLLSHSELMESAGRGKFKYKGKK